MPNKIMGRGRCRVLLLAVLCMGMQVAFSQQKKVTVVAEKISAAELDGIKRTLRLQGFATEEVVLSALSSKLAAGSIQQLWYHRTDTMPFTSVEKALSEPVRKFVANGGKLFLSMEAFPLLHLWGFEKYAPELRVDTIKDEGFGRPLGYHGFKQHPLFDGLSGGAYVSKQSKDHLARKHGYFEGKVPQGKVAGVQWTYITFWEDQKLLLEYDYQKGKVLAAGAFLDYASANLNRKQLDLFTGNVFRYLNKATAENGGYWRFSPPSIAFGKEQTGVRSLPAAESWRLPAAILEEKANSAGNAFYDLVGRKILWMGKLNGGTDEVWMHPFMALRDLVYGVKITGSDTITWLNNVTAAVRVTPEYLVRTYKIGQHTIREVITVAFDAPAGVAHLEWDGGITEVSVRFASSLRYMWPYSHKATGHIQCNYDPAFRAHMFSAQNGDLNTVVAYSAAPSVAETKSDTALNQAQVQLRFAAPLTNALNLYVAGSAASKKEALTLLDKERNNMSSLFRQSNTYYSNLLNDNLSFETPDTLFNKGYQWALARTDQFLQTTPGIGTSLMAGFGTTARGWNGRHKVSGRPGYAWYFGRDAQWSAMAINGYGAFNQVKEVLETFVRFQDLDGKIYHELTSSGVAHYDASDATPLFIVLAAHYLRYSGDKATINKLWPALEQALAFCKSTDTDGDGLIENTNVGHGWIEGGPLFGTHTEFYLAGCWAAALNGMAYMASAIKKPVSDYAAQAEKVRKLIDTDFWNEEQGYFYNGKFADGTYMQQSTGFATVPMYLDAVTDPAKALRVIRRIAGSKFSTDWGIRMLEEDNPIYHAGSYHAGMVWPLYTGWGALAAFPNGLYKAGFQYIMNNLLVYRSWAPGSVEETLNGSVYKPNGVCSHQCWSETMVLQPAIEGMLGFRPDAVKGKMKLAPYFPWHWNFTRVKNIRMGKVLTHLEMKRKEKMTGFYFTSSGPASIHFEPAFPLHTTFEKVTVNGREVAFSSRKEADGIRLILELELSGKAGVEVYTKGGIGALPMVTPAEVDQPSKGLKILSEEVKSNHAQWLVEGRPGVAYTFKVFSAVPIKSVSNGAVVASDKSIYTISVNIPSGAQLYGQQNISVSF